MSFPNNKRNSFRVTDHVHLSAIRRSEDDVVELVEKFDDLRMQACLKTHFSHQKETRVPNLKVIKSRDSEIGAYLQYLESQIHQLAQLISDKSVKQDRDRLEMVPVNLSADGMRFCFEEPLEVGEHLELLIWLLPDELTVLALARVIRIEEEEGKVWVSVKFETIHEEDQEAIVRHVVRVQQNEIREQKAG